MRVLALDLGSKRIGVESRALRKNLEHELALEKRIPRAVHLAHAAGGDARYDFVAVNRAAFGQRIG